MNQFSKKFLYSGFKGRLPIEINLEMIKIIVKKIFNSKNDF